MAVLHQIYSAHCTLGTSAIERRADGSANRRVGLTARASSFLQGDVRAAFAAVSPFASFAVAAGGSDDKLARPQDHGLVRLVYHPDSKGWQIGGQVVWQDTSPLVSQSATPFGHFVCTSADEPLAAFTGLDLLRIWDAPGWVRCDSPTIPFDLPTLERLGDLQLLDSATGSTQRMTPTVSEEVLLALLTLPPGTSASDAFPAVIPPRWRVMPVHQRRELFRRTLIGALRVLETLHDSLLLVAEPSIAALFFLGILALVPPGPLRDRISYSTYEPHVDRLTTRLAATTFPLSAQADVPADRYRRGFVLHTFLGGKSTPVDTESPLVDELVNVVCSAGWSAVSALHAVFQAEQGTTLRDFLDVVASRRLVDSLLAPTTALPADDWERSDIARRSVGRMLAARLRTPPGQSVAGSTLEPLLNDVSRAGDERGLKIVQLLSGSPQAGMCQASVDYLTQRMHENGFVKLVEMPEIPLPRKVAALAHAVARYRRLPAGCEDLFDAPLGVTRAGRTSPRAQLAPLAHPLLKTLAPDLIRDLAERMPAEQRVTLWICLVVAAEGQQEKDRVVLLLARDMHEAPLSWAIECLGDDLDKLSPATRRELGLRFVQVLNGVHKSPAEFVEILAWLKRVERLIADLDESRIDPGEIGASWSPLSRLRGWLRVPDIVAAARVESGKRPSRWTAMLGDPRGELQHKVGRQLAEALAKALPHGIISGSVSAHEKATAMHELLRYMNAAELVGVDWRNRAAYFLEYDHWPGGQSEVVIASKRKKLALIIAGCVSAVIVTLLLLTFFLSGDHSTVALTGSEQTLDSNVGSTPSGTPGNSSSTVGSGNATGEGSVGVAPPAPPPPMTPPSSIPPSAIPPSAPTNPSGTPPATFPSDMPPQAEEDSGSLPDSAPESGPSVGNPVFGGGSNPGTAPMTPPATMPTTSRDYFVATAPNPPPWDLPLRVPVSELGGDLSAAAPQERELRWELVAWTGVRLEFDTLILHGLQEAMEPWRTPPKGSPDSPISFDTVRLGDRWVVRATSADARSIDIATFQIARDASKNTSKVVLEMKLNAAKENVKLRIQRQLFHCVVEVRDADSKPYFIALQPTVKSEPIPMTSEAVKEGNLRATTESADRIPRPESAKLGSLFLARGTLVYGEGQRMPFGEQGWQDAPGATEWPLPMPKDEPILADARIEIRADKELAKLDVVFPRDTDAEVEKELKEVKEQIQDAISARARFKKAQERQRSREEGEARKNRAESVKAIAEIVQVETKPEPELKDPGPPTAKEEKKQEQDRILAENKSKLMAYKSWLDDLIKKLDARQAEWMMRQSELTKKSGDYKNRYRTMTTEWRSKLKHAEVELYREVPLKDVQGKKIRVPVMLLPKSQANANRNQANF